MNQSCRFSVRLLGVACGVALAMSFQPTRGQQVPECFGNPAPESCIEIEGCTWLVPGCGHGQPARPACYPAQQCGGDLDCPPGWVCVFNVIYDPCAFSPCQACGTHGNFCMPRPGDVDGDGVVGVVDLLNLLAVWGPCPDDPDPCWADLDRDGVVELADLVGLLENWG